MAPAIVIELSGWPQDLLPPGGLAGVLSARRDGDYLVVVTDPAASDRVLRALLAGGNQVHVSAVYEQSEGEQ